MKVLINVSKVLLIAGLLFSCKVKLPNHQPQTHSVIFQPNGQTGVDAMIGNCVECNYINSNYGTHPDFLAAAATNKGNISYGRSLIYFDLSSIPANAEILEARLSLYSINSPGNGSHRTLDGSNESVIQKVTSPWDEMTVTWNNQPTSTDENQVFVPASTAGIQDYPNIDVSNLIRDLHANPAINYGLKFSLVTEQHYRQLVFASSDYSDSTKRPKLEVIYKD